VQKAQGGGCTAHHTPLLFSKGCNRMM